MPGKVPLSVVVIAKNEESCIEECLSSVSGWADEVLIIDDYSSDRTAEIAARYGRVIREKWDIEGKFRNWAYSQARNRWVFSLDADESFTPELREELSGMFASGEELPCSAYNVPLRNFIGNYWVRHGGWYPAYKVRMFRKDKFRYEEAEVHPRVFIEGKTGILKHEIIHRSYRDIAELIASNNGQTTLEARKWLRSGRKMRLFHFLYRTVDRFFRRYIGKRGFLDGFYGFVIAFTDSFYQFLSYLKYVEMIKTSSSKGQK